MRRQTIWFNQWFSSIYFTIIQIKQDFDVKIIGSSKNADHVYKTVVDEFFDEPSFNNHNEYVDWALEFCKKHKINVFFGKGYNRAISERKEDFKQIGVAVIIEDYELFRHFDSKANIYDELKGMINIPLYRIANTFHEFINAVNEFDEMGSKICFKYDRDEGASSFRFIGDIGIKSNYLKAPGGNNVTYSQARKILDDAWNRNEYKPIMVMPFLKGPEVSIDCYNSKKGLVAIPRFKENNRVEVIKNDARLNDFCNSIQCKYGFKFPYNVQFRWDSNDKPVLLEINPRLSGGLHISNLSGLVIVRYLLNDIIGIDYEVSAFKEVKISQLETPIVLQ